MLYSLYRILTITIRNIFYISKWTFGSNSKFSIKINQFETKITHWYLAIVCTEFQQLLYEIFFIFLNEHSTLTRNLILR
jgi:hypothetical protein